MITVSFHLDGPRIVGFTCQGHSGLAPAGEDIVCAAVSSAVRMAECAVNDVAGAEAAVSLDEANTSVSLRLKRGLESETEAICQAVLTAMMISLSQISEEYPENITVLEV
ncbi:MAG: ribosomal-processing cysteine protease Prp [Oscillospiraceae bacterium]|nr:ribosomal-processing cysteine protease Prp [Oscillospiraceae bacterium]